MLVCEIWCRFLREHFKSKLQMSPLLLHDAACLCLVWHLYTSNLSLSLSSLLGNCSEDKGCLTSAKPGYNYRPSPLFHLQHSYVCQKPDWQERSQQWAHHHHWWSRSEFYTVGMLERQAMLKKNYFLYLKISLGIKHFQVKIVLD